MAHMADHNQQNVTVTLSSAEAKELIRFCETGRLYEVEAWVAAGNRSRLRRRSERSEIEQLGRGSSTAVAGSGQLLRRGH